jgi:anti-sigma factor RsiW
MNHIDEGTIHAWIDGAVSAEQAREIEAHVAQCAQCSAAVAEARGLVAASSRILNALDDVPANVTPKRKAPIAPTAPKRQWRAASWVTGIAALLVAAVVLRTSREVPKEVIADRFFLPDSIAQTPPQRQAAAAPSAAIAPAESSSRRPVVASTQPVVVKTTPTRRQLRGLASSDAAIAARGDAGNRERAFEDSVRINASAKAAATERQLGKRSLQLSEVVVTGAAGGAPGSVGTAAGAVAGAAAPQPSPVTRASEPGSNLMKRTDVADVVGCYVLPLMVEHSNTQAPVAASERRARAVAPAAAQDLAARRTATTIIRLDTVMNAVGTVRDAQSDSTIGSWRIVGDSVLVENAARPIAWLRPSARRVCPDR